MLDTQDPDGGVAEWLKAPVLKTGVRETVPGVRIPPPPFIYDCNTANDRSSIGDALMPMSLALVVDQSKLNMSRPEAPGFSAVGTGGGGDAGLESPDGWIAGTHW